MMSTRQWLFFAVIATVLAAAQPAVPVPRPHPTCGPIVTVTVPTGQRRAFIFSLTAAVAEVSCFGWNFFAPQCAGPILGGITLNITDPVSGLSQRHNLTNMFSGSQISASFAFATPRVFAVTAELDAPLQCPVDVFLSWAARVKLIGASSSVPTLSFVAPNIIVARGPAALLTFMYASSGILSASDVAVTAVDASAPSCANVSTAVSQSNVTIASPTSFTWALPPQSRASNLRICVWTATLQKWVPTAVVHVFDANPAYFIANPPSVPPPRQPEKRSPQQSVAVLTFVGTALNPTSDRIIVLSSRNSMTCSAAAAGQQPASVSIGPLLAGDDNVTTTVRVTLGAVRDLFRVCYFLSALSTWNEVPNFDSIPRLTLNGTATQSASSASGTTAAPAAACTTAPVNTSFSAVTLDVVAVLTVAGSAIPNRLAESLSARLCLQSPSSVAVVRFDSGPTSSQVYVAITCPSTMAGCNSAERTAALVQYATNDWVAGLTSTSFVGFAGLAVPDLPESRDEDSAHVLLIGLAAGLCTTLVVVGLVAVVLGVHVYRRRASRRDARTSYEDPEDGEVIQGEVVVQVQSASRDDGDSDDHSPIPPPPTKPASALPPAIAAMYGMSAQPTTH